MIVRFENIYYRILYCQRTKTKNIILPAFPKAIQIYYIEKYEKWRETNIVSWISKMMNNSVSLLYSYLRGDERDKNFRTANKYNTHIEENGEKTGTKIYARDSRKLFFSSEKVGKDHLQISPKTHIFHKHPHKHTFIKKEK